MTKMLCPGCEKTAPVDFLDAAERHWHRKCALKALADNYRTPLSAAREGARRRRRVVVLLMIVLERTPLVNAAVGFHQTIAAHSNGHIQIGRNAWLVVSWDAGPQQWTAWLQPFVGANDRLIICETTDSFGGLAPQELWDWYNNAIASGTVTNSFSNLE